MSQDLAIEQDVVTDRRRGVDELGKGAGRLLEVAREKLDARSLAVKLAAHAVVLLLRPHCAGAHARECLTGRLDRAGQHESHRLEKSDRAGLELPALAAHGGFADVARHQVYALDLRDGDPESLGDGRLDQALAEADPHLAGDDLDEESRRLSVQSPDHCFQRSGLGVAARGADRLERRLDLAEGHRRRQRASVQRLAGPVAEVRMLAKNPAQLVLVAAGDRGHDLAEGRPSEPESAPL